MFPLILYSCCVKKQKFLTNDFMHPFRMTFYPRHTIVSQTSFPNKLLVNENTTLSQAVRLQSHLHCDDAKEDVFPHKRAATCGRCLFNTTHFQPSNQRERHLVSSCMPEIRSKLWEFRRGCISPWKWVGGACGCCIHNKTDLESCISKTSKYFRLVTFPSEKVKIMFDALSVAYFHDRNYNNRFGFWW